MARYTATREYNMLCTQTWTVETEEDLTAMVFDSFADADEIICNTGDLVNETFSTINDDGLSLLVEQQQPDIPLPGRAFDGGTVVASTWISDEGGPAMALVLLLMPTPGSYYRVANIEWRTPSVGWAVTESRPHPNIVPAVEDYQQNGGDY